MSVLCVLDFLVYRDVAIDNWWVPNSVAYADPVSLPSKMSIFVYMDSNPNFYLEIALFLSFIMVGWHADAVSLPSGNIIFAHIVWPLNDVNLCVHGQ